MAVLQRQPGGGGQGHSMMSWTPPPTSFPADEVLTLASSVSVHIFEYVLLVALLRLRLVNGHPSKHATSLSFLIHPFHLSFQPQ